MKSPQCVLPLALTVLATVAVHAQVGTNQFIPADKLPWQRESPAIPVQLASLWGDRTKGEAGTLLTTPAGFKSGPHSHTADYRALVVQGVWRHWVSSTGEGADISLHPGAYWTQVRTQVHEDECISQVPCVIFLLNQHPYQTEFPRR